MYQQLWGYKVEEKLYLGVREQKRLNTTALVHCVTSWRELRSEIGNITRPQFPLKIVRRHITCNMEAGRQKEKYQFRPLCGSLKSNITLIVTF
jgi:hypothetical protein